MELSKNDKKIARIIIERGFQQKFANGLYQFNDDVIGESCEVNDTITVTVNDTVNESLTESVKLRLVEMIYIWSKKAGSYEISKALHDKLHDK